MRTMRAMRARGHALFPCHAWSFERAGRVGIRPPPRGFERSSGDPGHPFRDGNPRARVKGIPSVLALPLSGLLALLLAKLAGGCRMLAESVCGGFGWLRIRIG
jgi:hypothetical protein